MIFYKVYNTKINQWYRGSGLWSEKEQTGKIYKQKNHVGAAITTLFYWSKPLDIEKEDLEIIEYEFKEISRGILR
jgi:hypothetical protein